MIYLRQSTASQEVPLGYFLDSANGNDEETGLTIANTDIKIWKAGATTLANKNSGGATHISNGIYYAVLDATDTDTIGSLVIFVHVAGALAVRVACVVLDEAVYDVMFGATAPATATNITGGTITTVTTLTNDPTGVGTLLTRLGTPANLGSGATVAANLADIEGFVDDIPTLQSEVDGIQADTEDIQSRLPAALVSGRIDASVGAMASNTLTAAAVAADTVAELQAGVSTLDAAGVRAAVGLASANLDTQLDALPTNAELSTALAAADDAVLSAISGLNNLSQANIRTAIGLASANLDTQLADLPTNTELATALGSADDAVLAAIAGLNNLSAAQVNAEIVDALTTDVIADSTPTNGTRPTIAQGVLLLTREATQRWVIGDEVQYRKEDGTTVAVTLELDDEAEPTRIRRTG